MKWPWDRTEQRQGTIGGSGNFSDQVIRLIESEAAQKATDAGTTAAVEAAAGLLSRAFMSAEVHAPPWAVEAISPDFLALTARNLVRAGASMHSIEMSGGRPWLASIAFWNFENSGNVDHPGDKRNWVVRATSYGPSSSHTRLIPWEGIVFTQWGTSPGTTYIGAGPLGFASTTARLAAETERSMADEVAGDLAQLFTFPQDGGDGGDEDPLAMLKADIRSARGKTRFVETTSAGWGDGKASAPQKDWKAERLGPMPPPTMPEIARDAFSRVLAACGVPPPLFTDSDGTSQAAGLRRWAILTRDPLARLLEAELAEKLETSVKLTFDRYATDLDARSKAFKNLVSNGVEIEKALGISGLMNDD